MNTAIQREAGGYGQTDVDHYRWVADKKRIDHLNYLELNTVVGDHINLTVLRGNAEIKIEATIIAQLQTG